MCEDRHSVCAYTQIDESPPPEGEENELKLTTKLYSQ